MGKVYESLKEIVTQRSKNIPVVLAGVKDTHALSLNEEIVELEESIVPRIGRVKAEDTTRRKDIASPKIEERLTAEVHGLQDELKKETLQSRDAEINDLKSQLQLLTRRLKEMSSFFKQVEALTTAELPSGSSVVAKEPTNRVQEKPADAELQEPVVTSEGTDSPQQTMPTEFFDRVTHELTEIMGPMAPVIVRDKVASLGESMEKFPNSRVRELLVIISKEILNENAKARFHVCFREYM